MSSVLYAAGAHTDDATGWQLPSTETLVAVVLVAVATVVGAWLARRGSGRSALLLAAASGILLIMAVLDLLPDAWTRPMRPACRCGRCRSPRSPRTG